MINREDITYKMKTIYKNKLLKICVPSKACYFDQVYKDNYQRFFDRERKDTGVNIIDN